MSAQPGRLHHVGIVVPSTEQASELIALLGMQEQGRGYVESYKAHCIFTEGNGGSPIEPSFPAAGHSRASIVDSEACTTSRLR